MIKITSDAADKLIDKLNSDIDELIEDIKNRAVYTAAITEDEKELAPSFDFCDSIKQIELLEEKIIKLKHARAVFNTTAMVYNGMTVDMCLTRMKMIMNQKGLFDKYARRLPKERVVNRISSAKEIEYMYTNYKISDAKKKALSLQDELFEIRKALNVVNSSVEFEVDIDM